VAVKMGVFLKYEEWADEKSLGSLTPRKAFLTVRNLAQYKGFEYARVVVSVDGEVITDAAFRVEDKSEVYEKFAGWHREG